MSTSTFDLPAPSYQRWDVANGHIAVSDDRVEVYGGCDTIENDVEIFLDVEFDRVPVAGALLQAAAALFQYEHGENWQGTFEAALLKVGLLRDPLKGKALNLNEVNSIKSQQALKELASTNLAGQGLLPEVVEALESAGTDLDLIRYACKMSWLRYLNKPHSGNFADCPKLFASAMKKQGARERFEAWLAKNPAPAKVEVPDPPAAKPDLEEPWCPACGQSRMKKYREAFSCPTCKHEKPLAGVRPDDFED